MAVLALLLATVLSCSGAAAAVPDPGAEDTYIYAGRLLADPASGTVLERRTIVVRADRIYAILVGFVPTNGQVVDLRDRFVLPGLIDSHVHLTLEMGPHTSREEVTKTSADRALDGAFFARRTLMAGFTTVVDMGGDFESALALRRAIVAGRVTGPTLLVAAPIGPHGGVFDFQGYRPEILHAIAPQGLCSGADSCRRAVRHAVQRGADLIKTASTGSVLSDTDSGLGQQIFPDELQAIVTTARQLGRATAIHAHARDGIAAALDAGAHSVEHGTFLDVSLARDMARERIALVPTLLVGRAGLAMLEQSGNASPQILEKAREVGDRMLAAAALAHRHGVRIVLGTDAGVFTHGQNGGEFALLVQAGLTPLEAIQAATTAAAEHLGRQDEIGSIAPGRYADIVAVADNPLLDVTLLERVEFVMKRGVSYLYAR